MSEAPPLNLFAQQESNRRRSFWLVTGFVLFFAWIGFGGDLAFYLQTRDLPPESYHHFVPFIGIGATLVAAGISWYSWHNGAGRVLWAAGAWELIDPATPEQKQLVNVVEEMSIAAGLPKPEVYVIDDPSPNAFATGISPNRAAITATTGLLTMMNREELEGVISHEMSHIKNYDVRLILIVSTLIGFAALLASLAWRSLFFARPRGRDAEQFVLVMVVAAALLTVVGVIVGPLIKLALSRRREELADVSGANLTRNPVGLMHALQKLEQNYKPFAKFNHATAAMCIDDPLQHHEPWFHHLFDTHPPLEERIAILDRIAHGQPA